MTKEVEKKSAVHSKYKKSVQGYPFVDVYAVCEIFEVEDSSGSVQHAIKKLLCAGKRGSKGYVQDLEEARDTINRKLELIERQVELDAQTEAYLEANLPPMPI